MAYRLAADAVLLLHLGFILFALFGALLVLRRRWIRWLHLPAVAWAAAIELAGAVCPLTYLENYLRERAGQRGYSGGFIDHYLLPLVYPSALTPTLQWLLAGIVLAINLLLYGWLFRRPGTRPSAPRD
ncbi:DUF2784 domain-containing protein [Pseudoduganella sp. OTU4001]|uniref:DUF2784 domain-containing protein n=1 Tax=Pseudoduganella sp. OTU4001 TaxID=3043854 RepID=UPI00313E0508